MQKLQLTLAWLRASIRASDNLQDTFAAVENAFWYKWVTLKAKSVDHRWSIVRCTLSQVPVFTNMWYPRRSGTTGIAFVFSLASSFIALQTLPDHLNIWIKAYLPYCTCGWHSSCVRQAGFTPSSWPSILSCAPNAKQSKFFVPTLVSLKLSLGSFNVAVKHSPDCPMGGCGATKSDKALWRHHSWLNVKFLLIELFFSNDHTVWVSRRYSVETMEAVPADLQPPQLIYIMLMCLRALAVQSGVFVSPTDMCWEQANPSGTHGPVGCTVGDGSNLGSALGCTEVSDSN